MFRYCLALLFAIVATTLRAQTPAETNTVALDGHNFTLPPGFTIERAALQSLCGRPICADLDEQGRLYIAEAAGAIDKPGIQAQVKPHRVVRLTDIDGDGRYDKSTVFADQMAFPEGVMWRDGSVYVAAPPQIWKLTDTDNDGVADKREIWFDGQTLTGCANDLHGPYAGPDGRIYWCKGAFAQQTYTLPSGKTFTTRAAHIFRATPDGRTIEPVMTGGMDNPVDTVFTPSGERIFSTTFLQRPAAGFRDGLIHAVYGGIYGKDHDPVYEPVHKWTSPDFMPVLVHQGPSAPCGLHRYESNQFGPDYQDNVFSCQFNLRKVSRHKLIPSGATYTTEDFDFVVSDNTDFHPTDVIEDADGSLLIMNTGGWYKLCCPSSQLVKDDVLGGIYRVRKSGATRPSDPRGDMIAWKTSSPANLARLLGDARPTWRRRAIDQLGQRGASAVKAIEPILSDANSQPRAALSAVWAACRIDGDQARAAIRQALKHTDDTVRQAASHAASLWRDKAALPQLASLLESNSRHNRRAAAEALGRIGDPAATEALLAALADPANDRMLEHSLTYALIEIGENDALRKAIHSDNPRTRRAALVALDQAGAGLDARLVIASFDDPDASIRDSARWIASRHAEWDKELAAYLKTRLESVTPADSEDGQLTSLLAKLTKSAAIQQLLADTIAGATSSSSSAHYALAAIAASGQKEMPAAWASAITALLASNSSLVNEALSALRAVPPSKSQSNSLTEALLRLADSSASNETRLAALSIVPGGVKAVSSAQLDLLLTFIDREQQPALRSMAADVISKARLTGPQLFELAARLPQTGPLELDRLLAAFTQSTDEAAGLQLVSSLARPELRAAVNVDSVKQRLAKYGPAVQAEAQKLLAAIDAENDHQSERLAALLASLPTGDLRSGQTIFNSTRVSCRNCHKIGYVGGTIGPDLTKIGSIRQPRELVESIVFPSAALVRGYEPTLVRTIDGQVHNGNVKKDAPDEIILTLAADKEVRLAREEIDAVMLGKISVMPAGLDKQLAPQELADLVEFLKNCK